MANSKEPTYLSAVENAGLVNDLRRRIAKLEIDNRTLRQENKELKFFKGIIERAARQRKPVIAETSGENDGKNINTKTST